MIKGKLTIIGNMEVEGEKLTGAFIECSKEELKAGRHLFGEEVIINASQPAVEKHCPLDGVPCDKAENQVGDMLCDDCKQ